MPQSSYVPGVCNIGPEEISRRRLVGWIGLGFALVLLVLLVLFGVDRWWRLFVFFPAMLSASGFLQAQFQFCSGFARRGVFNFGALGQIHEIRDDAAKKADRRQGNRILLYSVLVGAGIALVCVLAS